MLGGYSLATWLTERLSNEVAARTRLTNQRIAERFAKLAHEQIEKSCAWLASRALAPIDHVTKAAREISGHDLSRRLNLDLPDDEVGRLYCDRLHRAFAGGGGDDVVAAGPQRGADRPQDGGLVVDDEDARHRRPAACLIGSKGRSGLPI